MHEISNNVVCAYTQSDQSLCLSLEYSFSVKLLTEHHLGFLSLNGGCRGSSESTLVKMSNCWTSHAAAQIFYRNVPHDALKSNCSDRSAQVNKWSLVLKIEISLNDIFLTIDKNIITCARIQVSDPGL